MPRPISIPDQNYAMPDGLNPNGVFAYNIIRLLKRRNALSSGGCKAFYSPDEWKARGEEYGHGAVLIVVHDGGSHAPFFNLDYCKYEAHNAMFKQFERTCFYIEQCTSWYSAVYLT